MKSFESNKPRSLTVIPRRRNPGVAVTEKPKIMASNRGRSFERKCSTLFGFIFLNETLPMKSSTVNKPLFILYASRLAFPVAGSEILHQVFHRALFARLFVCFFSVESFQDYCNAFCVCVCDVRELSFLI